MDIFNILTFIGGISLFLFGMNIMGKALEKRAGGKLKKIINRMTSNKFLGLLTGLGVTAIIQSSSATTVMVVGFVNSGLMNLGQAINVIMGANIGTTVTSWLLSLAGISSGNMFINLLKPSSFSPILALIGIILYMFIKSEKKKDIGLILLGFAVLMFGMETMSTSVSGLKDVAWFKNMFISFENNPLLGVLVGAFVTAVIQSSSASIGILQAFATTGQISFGAAIPIILGQNIGTCITALFSSIGTNRNAKRASLVHLFFNVIGTIVALIIYMIIRGLIHPLLLDKSVTLIGIAIIHSLFNLFCVVLLVPFSTLLEKLVCKILPDKKDDKYTLIDERLLNTPAVALNQVNNKLISMADDAGMALNISLESLTDISNYEKIKEYEDKTDYYEDIIGSYLVKLSTKELIERDSKLVSSYLKIIGDLERIADHALNIGKIKNEIKDNEITFSNNANNELDVCFNAIKEIWSMTYLALKEYNISLAKKIEPLEQVIDLLVKRIRNNHINRIQKDECSINKGFILSDLLANIERISDHCSNVAGYIIDSHNDNLNSHQNILSYRMNEDFLELYDFYLAKYNNQIIIK